MSIELLEVFQAIRWGVKLFPAIPGTEIARNSGQIWTQHAQKPLEQLLVWPMYCWMRVHQALICLPFLRRAQLPLVLSMSQLKTLFLTGTRTQDLPQAIHDNSSTELCFLFTNIFKNLLDALWWKGDGCQFNQLLNINVCNIIENRNEYRLLPNFCLFLVGRIDHVST